MPISKEKLEQIDRDIAAARHQVETTRQQLRCREDYLESCLRHKAEMEAEYSNE